MKQLLAGAVQSERAAEKKLADVSAELEAAESRLAKAEAALQVGMLSLYSLSKPVWSCHFAHILLQAKHFGTTGILRRRSQFVGPFISVKR